MKLFIFFNFFKLILLARWLKVKSSQRQYKFCIVKYSKAFIIAILSVLICSSTVMGAKFTSRFRKRIAIKSGERIRLTEELINAMHVIKMHAWEKPYYNLLNQARK